jgi:hypothetical protein
MRRATSQKETKKKNVNFCVPLHLLHLLLVVVLAGFLLLGKCLRSVRRLECESLCPFAYGHSSRSGMIQRPIGLINKERPGVANTWPIRSSEKRPAEGKRTLTDVDEVISEKSFGAVPSADRSVTSADCLSRRLVVSGRRLVRSRWA